MILSDPSIFIIDANAGATLNIWGLEITYKAV